MLKYFLAGATIIAITHTGPHPNAGIAAGLAFAALPLLWFGIKESRRRPRFEMVLPLSPPPHQSPRAAHSIRARRDDRGCSRSSAAA